MRPDPKAVYVWTFTGHDAKTSNLLNVRGWEAWDLDDDLKIRSSRGWYDAEERAPSGGELNWSAYPDPTPVNLPDQRSPATSRVLAGRG